MITKLYLSRSLHIQSIKITWTWRSVKESPAIVHVSAQATGPGMRCDINVGGAMLLAGSEIPILPMHKTRSLLVTPVLLG